MASVTFDQLRVGQSIQDSMTVTETHLVLTAGIFKDFNPVHSDESFASAGRFGTRVVHGMLTAGMMIGVLGSFLGAGALALVEQQLSFVAAVHPGDTLVTNWTVDTLKPKPRLREGGGLVVFRGSCRNNRDEAVIEGSCKFLVRGIESVGQGH